MRKSEVLITIIIIASFITSAVLYPSAPALMASHWDINGNVNDYLPKFWGLFIMPLVSLGLLLLFRFIPLIDPLKKNVAKFRGYFNNFIIIIILFLLAMYVITLLWNYGIIINITYAVVPALAVLMYYTGVLLEHAKTNWFIGIRTPWTMSNDRVWNHTHKLGAKLFKISSLVVLLGLLATNWAIIILLVTIITMTIYLVAYSYYDYKQELKH
ncbi:MAG: SdpI family protein [Candidatus Nanoarchaeia archaeon]|jgi:uncharacterized membrane protein